MNSRLLTLFLRIPVGAVFLYAGATKVFGTLDLADSIESFGILPTILINPMALWLPSFEVFLGLMLVSGWEVRAASLATALLTLVFLLALGQALIRGLEVDCGCFGKGKYSASKMWYSIGRDLALAGASILIYRLELKRLVTTHHTRSAADGDSVSV